MNEEEIKAQIFEAIKKIAPDAKPETLNGNQNFREELDLDSFDFLQLMIAISEKLNIEIKESEYTSVSTLQSLTDYILKSK